MSSGWAAIAVADCIVHYAIGYILHHFVGYGVR